MDYFRNRKTNLNQPVKGQADKHPNKQFRHLFVDIIPNVIEDGILYVCIKYDTAIHKCACGCGEEVITPLSPSGWTLVYNGKTVTLTPSIGNWSYRCKSHYWLKEDTIIWAAQWSDEKIKKSRGIDTRR